MSRFKPAICALLALIAVASVTAACSVGQEYATSTSDTHVCVFDGSERGGQKLKFQVPPGSESKEVDDNDQLVRISAANRFWMVSSNRAIADPGTPNNYTGNGKNGVPVFIEGQIRFRFNLELACEWYSKHGRRNADEDGDLRFNARGDEALSSGWFKFGNENFVLTMQEVVSEELSRFDAEALHYNWPNDYNPETGQGTGTPIRQDLGKVLGDAYTDRLAANLGGEYFCGIAEGTDDPCPPITFQVVYAGPGNDSPLVQNRDRVEDRRRALEAQRDEAALQAEQQAALLQAEQAKAAILEAQRNNANIQADIDTAKCRRLAEFGLDCEGKHPTYVFPNNTTGQ